MHASLRLPGEALEVRERNLRNGAAWITSRIDIRWPHRVHFGLFAWLHVLLTAKPQDLVLVPNWLHPCNLQPGR
jgi:hypothetical protein